MVVYQDLHKRFDRPVLAGVDLEVGRGETIAVVGHSGTGQSLDNLLRIDRHGLLRHRAPEWTV